MLGGEGGVYALSVFSLLVALTSISLSLISLLHVAPAPLSRLERISQCIGVIGNYHMLYTLIEIHSYQLDFVI